jgi:hypothetical protein
MTRVLNRARSDKAFRGVTIAVGIYVAQAVAVFSLVAGLTFVDAVRHAIFPLSVPGTGNVQIYSVAYAVLGIGLAIAYTAKVADVFLSPVDRPARR